MELTLTRKIKLVPTTEQEQCLVATSKNYTDACNYIARFCMENKTLSAKTIQESTYHDVRETFDLPSQMAISSVRTVKAAYRTIHSKQKKWSITPVFKKQKYNLVWNRDYSLNRKTGYFSINTIYGRQHIKTEWAGNEEYRDMEKYGTATINFKHGYWFIHVPVTIKVDELDLADVENIVGVDLGINFLATTHDTNGKTRFFDGRKVKHKRGQYKTLRSQLQKKGTRSARRRLKKIGQRENRWMGDVNHTITKALAKTERPTLFVLEDLTGIRNVTERVRVRNRYTQVSWAFHDFRLKMEYKARLYGHQIIFVDPAYTSQKCPKCGHTHKENRDKKNHIFRCMKCGYVSNDDRVAAMNLRDMGIQYRAQCSTSTSDTVGALSIAPQCSGTTSGFGGIKVGGDSVSVCTTGQGQAPSVRAG